jgi:hypothetical protein
MKLINCPSRRLEQASHSAPYSALSYVWCRTIHTENAPQPWTNILPSSLPKTIEDANSCNYVSGLRTSPGRHNFVLIRTMQKGRKFKQIRQMSLFYQNAELTIVAGSVSNSDAGLPGVSDTFRGLCSGKRSFQSTLLVALKCTPPCVILVSPWRRAAGLFKKPFYPPSSFCCSQSSRYIPNVGPQTSTRPFVMG